MKRSISVLIIISSLFCFCSCANKRVESRNKPITGTDPVFIEELGFYNESPCVIQNGLKRYMFYTKNEKKFDNSSNVVSLRVADYKNGNWIYKESKTVLSKAKSGWDSGSIFAPDIIKGNFKFNGKDYYYLMAYSGSNKINRNNAQIGFAVSETLDGEYIRVGQNPIFKFDKKNESSVGLSNYKGLTEPSLVSFDNSGKFTMFYSYYGKFNCSYAVEMDCSNLDNIVRGGRIKVNTAGLRDGLENTMLFSADYAYDSENDIYVACKNYGGHTSGLPSVSEAVQVVKANKADIFRVNDNQPGAIDIKPIWSLYNNRLRRISAIQTGIDSEEITVKSNGYKRIYNGTILSDFYGNVLSTREVVVYFTSSAVNGDEKLNGDEYLYTPMIHEMIVKKGE